MREGIRWEKGCKGGEEAVIREEVEDEVGKVFFCGKKEKANRRLEK